MRILHHGVIFSKALRSVLQSFTAPSTCSWVGHCFLVYDMILRRPIQTRLPAAPSSTNSCIISARSPINGLELAVGTRFQVLFHPLPGAFHLPLTVLVHYRSLGDEMGDGPPRFRADFVSRCNFRTLLGTKTILNTRLLLLADLPKSFFYNL